MRTAGIIAECNPFHEGHAHLLRRARSVSGADYVIVVLSGDYVQRGAPAIQDKYLRTRAVLEGGADLVLELPLYYACGAADYFARGAVTLLARLNVVTDLVFGSESADLNALLKAADALKDRGSDRFRDSLLKGLRRGQTYAQAQAAFSPDIPKSSNDLLGAHYLAAASAFQDDSAPQFHAEKRIPAPSASELRSRMLASGDRLTAPYLCTNDFSGALLMRLLEQQDHLEDYADVSGPLADRIRAQLPSYRGFEDFVSQVKTRDVTYTRVARSLLHILLDVRTADLMQLQELGVIPYVRVLGLRDSASALLSEISRKASCPILVRSADAEHLPDGKSQALLQKEIRAAWLYDLTAAGLASSEKNGAVPEYGRRLIRI